MKNNYSAWEIDVETFPREGTTSQKLEFLIRFAVLAPSSHNTQPWKFEIHTDKNEIVLSPDYSRALEKSDPGNKLLFVSLGCALENLLVAAEYYGFSSEVFYDQPTPEKISIRLAQNNPTSSDKTFIQSIVTRATNRNKYKNIAPSAEILSLVYSCATRDTSVNILTEEKERLVAADITNRAGKEAFVDADFRKELAHHMKSNTTSSSTGMPGFGMGMPLPVSFVAPLVVPRFGLPKNIEKENGELLEKHTPAFVIISTIGNTKNDWINAGRISQKIMLLAEQNGYHTHPLAASVVIGEYWKEMQALIKTSFRPQFFLRLGQAEKSERHSPRLRVEEVM